MPHCLAHHINLPSLPFCEEGYEFLYEVQKLGNPKESLIFVRFAQYEFFLRKRFRDRRNDYILKCEKISASLPTGIIKGAIKILAQYNQEHLITHNLNNNSPRQNLQSPYLKKISDFLDFSTPFELEIGFGSGRHILQKARNNPNRLFVGIEIHTPSIEQVLRQIELLGLQNLWIINFDARIFLELIPSNLLKAIYVHFPVPWGKKPHRRVWSERFVQESMRVLEQGCRLELRSDDEDYFSYALQVSLLNPILQMQVRKNLSVEVVSKYEQRWRKMEKNIYDLHLTSLEVSKPRDRVDAFDFPKPREDIWGSFDTISRQIIGQDYFLHIDSFYIHQFQCVVMLSFGDFNQPQSKFLLISHNQMSYIGGNPIPTQATYKAHQELVKLFGARSGF